MDDNNQKSELKVLFNICNAYDNIFDSPFFKKYNITDTPQLDDDLTKYFYFGDNIDIALSFENWLITDIVNKRNILEENNDSSVPD